MIKCIGISTKSTFFPSSHPLSLLPAILSGRNKLNPLASVARPPSWRFGSSRWWWSSSSTTSTFFLARNSARLYEKEEVHTRTHTCKLAKTLAPYCCFYRCFPFPGHNSLSRPKSLLISSPSTKLLTLEEAQARTQAQINSPVTEDSKYIEVGEGPAALQGKFHTVIEFPTERFVIFASHLDHCINLNHDTQALTCQCQ